VGITVDGKGRWAALDPYHGAVAIALEAISNLACVGVTPKALVNNLNFGNPEHPEVMHTFSEVVRGASAVCLASSTPVVGGNVSFYNESNGTNIDPTPVFGVVGTRESIEGYIPGVAWNQDDVIVMVVPNGPKTSATLAGSEFATMSDQRDGMCPVVDISTSLATCSLVREVVLEHEISAVHDISDGGLATCLSEMSCASGIGFDASLRPDHSPVYSLFNEGPARFIVAVNEERLALVMQTLDKGTTTATVIGRVGGDVCSITHSGEQVVSVPVSLVKKTWSEALEKAIHQ